MVYFKENPSLKFMIWCFFPYFWFNTHVFNSPKMRQSIDLISMIRILWKILKNAGNFGTDVGETYIAAKELAHAKFKIATKPRSKRRYNNSKSPLFSFGFFHLRSRFLFLDFSWKDGSRVPTNLSHRDFRKSFPQKTFRLASFSCEVRALFVWHILPYPSFILLMAEIRLTSWGW